MRGRSVETPEAGGRLDPSGVAAEVVNDVIAELEEPTDSNTLIDPQMPDSVCAISFDPSTKFWLLPY